MNNSDEEFKRVVKRGLSQNLSGYILENFEKLPIEIKEIPHVVAFTIEYTLSAILIDKEELKRLKDIEKSYFQILEKSLIKFK
jgi:hypothetical protein